MKNINYIFLTAVFITGLMVTGCSKSNDQKKFEQQAYSTPNNITALDSNGQSLSTGQTDPEDWRISPDYQGLIEMNKSAYPNPVFINSFFRIQLYIRDLLNLSSIDFYAFQFPDEPFYLTSIDEAEISSTGFPEIRINASTLPDNKANNLYRIILLDQNGNVITYGDVQVQQ